MQQGARVDWLICFCIDCLICSKSAIYTNMLRIFLIWNDSWHCPESKKRNFTSYRHSSMWTLQPASSVDCLIGLHDLVFFSLCDLPLSFRYIYSEESDEMTIENVMQTLYCAKRFAMPKLAENCREFVQDNLSAENCCLIYAEVCSMTFSITENVSNFVFKVYRRVSCNVFGNFDAYCCFRRSGFKWFNTPSGSHSIDWLIGGWVKSA